MKLTAKVTEESIADGIRYLVIEQDEEDTKGFFLFMHRSLEEPCDADLWFAELEGAKRQAKVNYGIELDDWQNVKG